MIETINISENSNACDLIRVVLNGEKSYSIRVEKNARAQIVFESVSGDNQINLCLDSNASVTIFDYALNPDQVNNQFSVELNESGASCTMRGVFITADKQQYTSHIVMRHNAAQTTSEQNYKGIAQDDSRANFFSRVVVKENAQKISSTQSSKNLLLSKNAMISAKPELEIYADDVQCAHGATVGELDHNAIFYLRSRGVPFERAKAMLTYAFIAENIDPQFENELKSKILAKITQNEQMELVS